MSPSFFKGFLLLGFLYLWMTPSEQAITITQHPLPAKMNQSVSLNVTGVDPNITVYCSWFQARVPYMKKWMGSYVNSSTPRTVNGTLNIAEVQTNCTLIFKSFHKSDVGFYTLEILNGDVLEIITAILRANNSCVASLSLFLLAAALFSSLGFL